MGVCNAKPDQRPLHNLLTVIARRVCAVAIRPERSLRGQSPRQSHALRDCFVGLRPPRNDKQDFVQGSQPEGFFAEVVIFVKFYLRGFIQRRACLALQFLLEFPEFLRHKLITANNIKVFYMTLSKPHRIFNEEMRCNDYRYLGKCRELKC